MQGNVITKYNVINEHTLKKDKINNCRIY